MAPWILPTLGYVVILGAAGVTAKVALRTITWQQLVLWLPVAYLLFAIFVIVFQGQRFPFGAGGGWAALTAVGMSSALILLFYALTKGDAAKIVPVSSAYPVVTLAGAALFLAESITLLRVVGTGLVIGGVILLSR